ncbi:Kinesin-like protein kif21b [Apophysomyces sp. BC1034]|nr:Kinesin-like protein kif21b [Apophysomyces sp. BC1015]KAG0190017.1 Kinesin-like protein kif21b [Apophysomyces sp. BC1034]
MATTSSVRVAVRVRPLTELEKQQRCTNLVAFVPNQPQIIIGQDRSFTFDYAYPPSTEQDEVYQTAVVPLLNKFVEGQTGSGKTYSMGIGLDSALNALNEGIVPRFIGSLFERLDALKYLGHSCQISVSFLELHNEDLVDLLSPTKREGLNLSIREDSHGNICWSGVREEVVKTPQELLGYLQKGSIARTTASTDMNHTSSRSHAIFSIQLKQTIQEEINDNDEVHNPSVHPNSPGSPTVSSTACKSLVSKFHFVDLAGSERLKRTNAIGDRAREGISINSGLLALGNVISALGDESRRVSHIPYRDSKLTRLLQDSLGGNSQTLMLACVSPADSNATETLNTLKYANRARNIRNRVAINQEQGETDRLKSHISKLKEELKSNHEFLTAVNDEMDSLKSQVEKLNVVNATMADDLAKTKYERDILRCQTLSIDGTSTDQVHALVAEYAQTIETLKLQVMQASEKRRSFQTDEETIVPTADRKKKRHSYRFGNKRPQRGRRRQSLSISPKFDVRHKEKEARTVPQWKAVIHEELQWFQNIQINDDSGENVQLSEDADASSIEEGKEEGNDSVLRAVLEKYRRSLGTKQQLVHQLEQAESKCREMDQQLASLTTSISRISSQNKQELEDIHEQYETKQKKQWTELKALRKKHAQLLSSTGATQTQNEASLKCLNQRLEDLKHEKKKMMKRMKQESDRARERCGDHEREIQKLRQDAQVRKRKDREPPSQKPPSQKPSNQKPASQKPSIKRTSTEDMAMLNCQMKQVATMLKKALAQKTVDRALLAKAIACASVGVCVKQGSKFTANAVCQPAVLKKCVLDRKRLIHKAIAVCVQGQMPYKKSLVDIAQKRDRLLQEQKELLAERQLVLKDEAAQMSPCDPAVPQYMDERIDTITAHVDLLNHQYEQLQSSCNNSEDNHETDNDSDHTSNSNDEMAYTFLRTLGLAETRLVAEALIQDIIHLKTEQQTTSVVLRNMDKALALSQHVLVQMRRAAQAKITGGMEGAEIFDTLYIRAMHGPVKVMHGLMLLVNPPEPEQPSVDGSARKIRTSIGNYRSSVPVLIKQLQRS